MNRIETSGQTGIVEREPQSEGPLRKVAALVNDYEFSVPEVARLLRAGRGTIKGWVNEDSDRAIRERYSHHLEDVFSSVWALREVLEPGQVVRVLDKRFDSLEGRTPREIILYDHERSGEQLDAVVREFVAVLRRGRDD